MNIFYVKPYLFTLVILFSGGVIFAGKKVTVRILHTTDLHSFIDEGDNKGRGGWLRVASLIKKNRKNFGEENTLLLDCGDTIQGSISAIATRGEAAVDLINHLKYDAWVLGNHELDFGVPRLHELIEKTKVPILAGNFKLKPPYEKEFSSWKIINKNGVKVCVIGMQASYLKEWFKGRLYQKYEVEKAYDVLLREMPKILKQKPHMIILAMHHGFLFKDSRGVNEVKEIAKRFPEIDLILGGHTHQSHPGRNVFGVYYSQAAFHGSHLGVINAQIDLEKGVEKLESFLEEASSEIPKDSDAMDIYSKWRPRVEQFSSEPIIELAEEISSRGVPGYGSMVSELIAKSIRKVSKSDFAIHGKFTSENLSEKVTEYDLYRIIPYENFIFKLTVTREQLFKIMEEQVKFIKSRSFNGPVGFELILSEDKKDLLDLKLPFEKESYTLAVNSRVAAGGGGRFLWLKKEILEERIKVEEIEVNSRQAVKRFLVDNEQKYSSKESHD